MSGTARTRRLATGTALLLTLVGIGSMAGLACGPRRQEISAALVRTSDLPAGWTATDLSDLDLDELGDADLSELARITPQDLGLDPRGACAMALTPLLRQIGRNPPSIDLAVYQRSELGPFLVHVVAVVPPGLVQGLAAFFTSGAAATFAEACQAELMASGPELDLPTPEEIGFSIQTTPLKFASIGDATFAQRTDITIGFLGTTLISVVTARGEAISMLFLLTDPNSATTSVGMLEQLARTADARLAQLVR